MLWLSLWMCRSWGDDMINLVKKFGVKRLISIFIVFVLLIVVLPVFGHYFKNYTDSNYLYFEKELGYHDIFYSPEFEWWKMYGIGDSDIETSKYLLNNPTSDLKKFYDKNNMFAHSANLMSDLIFLLEDCSFKSVERTDAFWMSLLFNYNNNISTLRLSSSILSKQLHSKNAHPEKSEIVFGEYDLENIGIELESDDIRIMHAGIYEFHGKTYLVADYAEPGFVVGMLSANQNLDLSLFETKTVMYEIVDSDAENEIVERKYAFKTAKFDCYDCSPW